MIRSIPSLEGLADPPAQSTLAPSADAVCKAARLRSIVAEHYTSLWRFLRRLGVPEADAEDAAQKCLCVLAERLDDVTPGKDKSFLLGIALRVAPAARRVERRHDVDGGERLDELPAPGADPGQQLDDRRTLAALDILLAAMPLELRTVFVLYEIEELTMAEIARVLHVPAGTVASRLRRARLDFEQRSRDLRRERRGEERSR